MEKFEFKVERNHEKLNKFLDEFFPDQNERHENDKKELPITIDRGKLQELFQTGEGLENILEEIVKRGYILHGSKHDMEKLEPRQAKGEGRKTAQLNAIYATDKVLISLFAATSPKNRKDGGEYRAEWGFLENEDDATDSMEFKATQDWIDSMSDGYIYILKKEDFKKVAGTPGEYIRRDDSQSFIKVLVKKEDFKYIIKILE